MVQACWSPRGIEKLKFSSPFVLRTLVLTPIVNSRESRQCRSKSIEYIVNTDGINRVPKARLTELVLSSLDWSGYSYTVYLVPVVTNAFCDVVFGSVVW